MLWPNPTICNQISKISLCYSVRLMHKRRHMHRYRATDTATRSRHKWAETRVRQRFKSRKRRSTSIIRRLSRLRVVLRSLLALRARHQTSSTRPWCIMQVIYRIKTKLSSSKIIRTSNVSKASQISKFKSLMIIFLKCLYYILESSRSAFIMKNLNHYFAAMQQC